MSNNYEQPVEPMSRVEDILRGDTANVPQSRVEDLLKQLIEQGGGGGGSTVIVTQILSEGTKIASISVNGSIVDIYAPTDTGSTVSISTIQQTGTKIATLTIDDTDYDIYAPEGGGGGGNLYGTTDPTSDQGSNGDIYMKYQGGSEPVEGETETLTNVYFEITRGNDWVALPNFDASLYYSVIFNHGVNPQLSTKINISDISTDANNPTIFGNTYDDLYGYINNSTLYLKTVIWNSVINSAIVTKNVFQPPQILNVFGKVENKWAEFPGYSETVLYDTPVTPTIQSPATIELNDSYRNYDALIFYITNATDNYYATPMIMTRDIAVNHRYLQDGYGNMSFAISATFLSDTSLTVERPTSSGKAVTYEKIYGIKYGNGGGSGSSSHNYSTEEQVVGTWIDGKPLYQKTVEYSSVTANAWNEKLIDSNADFINVEGYLLTTVGTKLPLNYDTDSTYFSAIMGYRSNNTYAQGYLSIYTNASNASSAIVTVRYTKTTD